MILGSGPNRIGQGIEFDYCCVHAAQSFRALGYEAVMVNCNPETVSTDYDTSDRLYFEPLGVEEVLAICEREQPAGVVIQFGGQTPLKLARAIEAAGFRVLGTPFEAVDLAEDRERFAALCDGLGIAVPPWGTATTADEAVEVAERVGYPVLVRPSYVLGGRSMRVCYDAEAVRESAAVGGTLLVDRFLENAIEIDVDALCDGNQTFVAAVMQHVEEAGVHSGDSSCVLPAPSLTRSERRAVAHAVRRLGPALGVVGLLNVQLALADGELFVLEANPRASRTVPFASKATGVNLVQAACRLAAGATLPELELAETKSKDQVSVKAAVLPFARFPGADPVLGPEMRSTGEVMASASDLPTAFAKAERAAGRRLPATGTAFLSVRDEDKARRGPGRPGACRARLPAARHRGHRTHARRRGARGRVRAQGDRGGRGPDGRRPRPARALRPRDQHAAGLGGAHRRLPDPRGGARRAHPVHHDHLGRGRCRRGDRARARRGRAQPAGTDRCSGANGLASSPPRRSGRTRCCASSAARSTRAGRASSSCSRRPAGCCRGR